MHVVLYTMVTSWAPWMLILIHSPSWRMACFSRDTDKSLFQVPAGCGDLHRHALALPAAGRRLQQQQPARAGACLTYCKPMSGLLVWVCGGVSLCSQNCSFVLFPALLVLCVHPMRIANTNADGCLKSS